MIDQTFSVLGFGLLISEVFLGLRRRANSSSENKDQGSLRKLWLIILASILAGALAAMVQIGPLLLPGVRGNFLSIVVFLLGTIIRWWAIIHLGRFFTVNVAVAQDHQLVSDGPYRAVRHPSYSGLILQFAGLALSLGYVSSFVVMLVPIILVLRHRILIEENALTEKLGQPYQQYCAKTKRLLPYLY